MRNVVIDFNLSSKLLCRVSLVKLQMPSSCVQWCIQPFWRRTPKSARCNCLKHFSFFSFISPSSQLMYLVSDSVATLFLCPGRVGCLLFMSVKGVLTLIWLDCAVLWISFQTPGENDPWTSRNADYQLLSTTFTHTDTQRHNRGTILRHTQTHGKLNNQLSSMLLLLSSVLSAALCSTALLTRHHFKQFGHFNIFTLSKCFVICLSLSPSVSFKSLFFFGPLFFRLLVSLILCVQPTCLFSDPVLHRVLRCHLGSGGKTRSRHRPGVCPQHDINDITC